ncbi:MAG: FIST C-terminal domain-containing protein [Phycisphaerales bacterium]|nr:FIST C-terminal domain-containing protein [Phycisphaerales bacterium]
MTSLPSESAGPRDEPADGAPVAAAALSRHHDTRTAATELAETLYETVNEDCDLLMVFGSFHHRAAFPLAVETLRQTIHPSTTIGVTAESVLGGDVECEGTAGISALALRIPGMDVRGWSAGPGVPLRAADPDALREQTGIDAQSKGVILLADPFTTPVKHVLRALSGLAPRSTTIPIVGGLASGASQPGHNLIILDDQAQSAGVVGVTLGGPVDISCVVSQGCRPVGTSHVITRAKGNTIHELGGRPATEVLHEQASELPKHEKMLLSRGLFVGQVINEHKSHFGRGDFLIRAVTGMDNETGRLIVGDQVRTGQTIQFHVRDAETADEDFNLLLDMQQLHDEPLAGLLVTCNGRGTRLFNEESHDTRTIRRRLGDIPIAGFFAAGEIGPIGDQSFLHGHTACLVLIRALGTNQRRI